MKNRFLTILFLSVLFLFLLVAETCIPVLAQTSDTVVAKVSGRSITLKEVDSAITSQLFPLEQKIYAIRKAALENLVLRAILEHEAKGHGVSVEELRKKMTDGKVDVLPNQVEEVYSTNASVFGAMSPDEAKERLRLDLESQARMGNYRATLTALRTGSNVQVFLEEPKLPSLPQANNAQSTGSKEPLVTITEFADFQCSYCREVQGVIKQILKSYDNVRIIFKHLPLDIHNQAFASAQAAVCAGEQDLFWLYHDALFASKVLSPEALNKSALDVGLSLPKFTACVLSDTTRATLRRDIQEAKQLGIDSTPTFVINGKIVRGAISFESFKAIIEHELKFAQNIPSP
jgi:protein-disulfide isomerase